MPRRPHAAPTLWAGHPIAELEEAIGVAVVGVNRLGAAIVPTAAPCAQAGDVLYLAVPRRPGWPTSTPRCAAGPRRATDVRVVIAGGGSVGRFIAEQLHGAGHDVTIIDNDRASS